MGSVRYAVRSTFLKVAFWTLLLFLLPSIYLRLAHAESPQMQWAHVHPYPSGQLLNSAAWGPPGYVVVGWDREVVFSEDGHAWERIILTNVSKGLWVTYKVCYYGGKYVVIGNPGSILWSSDGRNWNDANPGTNLLLRACAGGDGKYLVAGFDRSLLVSTKRAGLGNAECSG
jgi:hypothetical protein